MIPDLVHSANCPVGGNFACTCGAEDAANARLSEAVQAYSRLTKMTPQALVNLALEHMPDMPFAYEQVIEELCTRVYPNWSNEDPEPQRCACHGLIQGACPFDAGSTAQRASDAK